MSNTKLETMLEFPNVIEILFSSSSVLVKTEQERDKLSIDCERLDLQCQQFKSKQSRYMV